MPMLASNGEPNPPTAACRQLLGRASADTVTPSLPRTKFWLIDEEARPGSDKLRSYRGPRFYVRLVAIGHDARSRRLARLPAEV